MCTTLLYIYDSHMPWPCTHSHGCSACLLLVFGREGRRTDTTHIQKRSSHRNTSSITKFLTGARRQNFEAESGIFDMFRSSQQGSQRCKDLKVKRALQICVLLGVCIWLVYLAQHSREKRTSYSHGTKTGNEVAKLGRKDPHPYVEQSSIIDVGNKEERDEQENKHQERNETDNVKGVEDEILTQKNDPNNNEEKSEHRQDQVDQDTQESVVTNNESEENEHKDNKESDSVIKENEDDKSKVEQNQSREISEEKNESEKKETTETETGNKENEEINQNKTEDRGQNQHRERNNEEQEPIEEHHASNVVGLNKTEEQSDKSENNEFELESQTNDTELAHLHRNERVLNVTQPKTTQVTDVETLHSQNGTDITSNTAEKQFETSENSKVEDSGLHNTTLKMKDSNSNAAVEQADSTLTNSSRVYESNVTNEEYNGKENASDSSILEEKDTSSNNNDHAGKVEDENIGKSENEDGTENEP